MINIFRIESWPILGLISRNTLAKLLDLLAQIETGRRLEP